MTKRKKEKQGRRPIATPSDRELVVVVNPQVGLRAKGAEISALGDADVNSISDLLDDEGATMAPLFGDSEERMAASINLAAERGAEIPDLTLYYRVDAPDQRLDSLAEKLMEEDAVDAAYVKPPSEAPIAPDSDAGMLAESFATDSAPVTPDFTARQIYLNEAPAGIDARYAWTQNGGRGAGVRIIDIEGGWNFTHEDLIQNQGGVIGGTPTSDLGWRNHGTAVVGEFGGDRNSIGITGICPDANVRAVSIFGGLGSAGAIRKSADALSAGDIILIELHRPGPRFNFQGRGDQRGYIAIEWWPDDFAAIRYAVGKGVIVVEAAGNGAENFDDALYDQRPSGFPASWKNPLNPSNPSSDAVVVGAGAPPPGTHGRDHGPDRSRLGFSNHGLRVDTQGWGREVTTAGYKDLQDGNENEWYTDRFSGTSSASPIVVGALGCVQGILKAQGGVALNPTSAISLLRSTGSDQQDAPGRPKTQRIGKRPNLRQAIGSVASSWLTNRTLGRTYATHHSKNAWAFINGLGWRKIKPTSNSGVTEVFDACCEAVANHRTVDVFVDGTSLRRIVMR